MRTIEVRSKAEKTSLRDNTDQQELESNSLPDAIKQLNDTVAIIPVTSADGERVIEFERYLYNVSRLFKNVWTCWSVRQPPEPTAS